MSEWLRQIVVPHFDDEELNRRAFNLNVTLLTTFAVMLLGVIAMLLQVGRRPLSYILPNTMFIVVAALILVLCYRLSRRGRVQAGSLIFVAMMAVACVGAVIVGGTQGALPVILIIPVAAAATTLGSNAGLAAAVLSVITLVVAGLLERSGAIEVLYPAPEVTILLNMFDVGFGLFFVTLSIWVAGYSLRQSLERTRQAVVEVNRYRQELEESLVAEQAIRDRLRRAIGDYAAFLERIGQGDYEARLSLAAEDEDLAVLERQINATVDALVAAVAKSEDALKEVEAAHRRYVLQEWRSYARSGVTTDFEVARPDATVRRDQLLRTLEQALAQRNVVTSTPNGEEVDEGGACATMAVPIELGGQVIGILGASREGDECSWGEDEQALAAAVIDRFALAVDGMRLLDETQRRAAREQLTREITDNIRAAVTVEDAIQRAVQEMGRALGASQVVARIGAERDLLSGQGGDDHE